MAMNRLKMCKIEGTGGNTFCNSLRNERTLNVIQLDWIGNIETVPKNVGAWINVRVVSTAHLAARAFAQSSR